MSRLYGLSQLRHVELLERAQAMIGPAPANYGQGAMLGRLASLTRDQLIGIVASGELPGGDPGAT